VQKRCCGAEPSFSRPTSQGLSPGSSASEPCSLIFPPHPLLFSLLCLIINYTFYWLAHVSLHHIMFSYLHFYPLHKVTPSPFSHQLFPLQSRFIPCILQNHRPSPQHYGKPHFIPFTHSLYTIPSRPFSLHYPHCCPPLRQLPHTQPLIVRITHQLPAYCCGSESGLVSQCGRLL
jgi:hypothetical protein